MKYLVDVFVIIVAFFLLGACSRTTERKEVIKNYWDNRELFHDAVEICQKYSELTPPTIISDWIIQ